MQRRPVVLVHGIYDDAGAFDVMRADLESRGAVTSAVSLSPNNGDASIVVLAAQLSAHVEALCARHDVPKVDVVAFSLGGLVARHFLQRLGGARRAERFVCVSSPHRGTLAGHFLQNAVARELRPGSDFLADLNRDWSVTAEQLEVTSIWTPFDAIIVPAHSSRLDGAHDVQLPVLLHPWMLTDARSLRAVAGALGL